MRPLRVEATTIDCVVTSLPRRAWWTVAALLTLLGALAGTLVSDAIWFDPQDLAQLDDYALDSEDSGVFALARARAPERAQADFLLLGSSAARESIWDEARLGQGGTGRFVKMTSSGQTPLESLFLLDQQPLRRGQVVLLAIGVSQLDRDYQWQRLRSGMFLQSPLAFAAAHPGFPIAQGNWLERRLEILRGARRLLVRYLHVALPRQMARRLYGVPPITQREFLYATTAPALAVTRQRQALRRDIDIHGSANLLQLDAALDAAARSCARQGAILVLLENPHLDSDLPTTFGAWWERYRGTVRQVAARHRLHYAKLADTLTLAPDDFADAVHMSGKGRDAWSAQLLREAPSWRMAGD